MVAVTLLVRVWKRNAGIMALNTTWSKGVAVIGECGGIVEKRSNGQRHLHKDLGKLKTMAGKWSCELDVALLRETFDM